MRRFPVVATGEQLDEIFAYFGTTHEGLHVYGRRNQRHEYAERPDGTLELAQSYADEISGQ
ncbi:MAG: hypothetical protein HYW27_04530 [Candidatus Aenigmarchaeota archaeon]|nr:hypothetical protein [Candidatus Aenigmarchaeota archaeon]